ncbi:rod shape-determining protein RodA [Spiractinospora alimapuensis]|uniref:rod shape-determining protein RodA n=1 Tax=Spiractinospora alimapuensis TaxID=2820884 RepID=UPI0037423315|nr:rod shape-determining protein RodA [Spiractinospora alimapuensis]
MSALPSLAPSRGSVTRVIRTGLPRRVDWVLVVSVVALSVLGSLLVWSATADPADPGVTDMFRRHIAHVSVGAIVCVVVAALDYRVPKAYASIIYLVVCVGLVLVLTPLGATINGSRGWLVAGPLQMQPSELAKVGVILVLAMLFGEPRDGEKAPTARDVLLGLGALAIPGILVVTQPDLGTALVFGAIFLTMLAVSGAPLLWIGGMLLAGFLAAGSVFWFDLLEPYQMDRLATLMEPSADPQGTGYNTNQALIAVGSGGVTGKGLFDGEQTAGHFVPEQHTDFVFTVAGEEFGFVGAAAVIGLIMIVLLRILRIARKCEVPYGRLLCVGVAAWFAFQSTVNIGMCLGIMPVTGIPLLFLSYGGTAAVAQFAAVGLVLAVNARDPGYD